MQILEHIMMFLLFIIGSNIINKKIPNISLPLIQIIIGLALWRFMGTSFEFESHFFMLLFVAPILYAESEHISNSELWKFRAPVFFMAIGLVLFTVFVVGYGLHWVIPQMPLSVCFALAAVLSPTDAVAVKALSSRVRLPHDVVMVAAGECLVNDASGLVAFNFAIAAALTGAFSMEAAAKSFAYINLGGIVIGIAAIILVNLITYILKHIGIDEAPVFTLLQLLTPFLIFLLAEELGYSGVLAVVAAGIVRSLHRNSRISAKDANIKYISDGAWATLIFALNGIIFLLLGMKLPDVMANAMAIEHTHNIILIAYVILISIALVIVRFIWAFIFVGTKHGKRLYNSILISLSGARGAITLAACFSIPLYLNDGVTPFPERDLVLFLSGGVIIAMLLITNIILPLVVPKRNKSDAEHFNTVNKRVVMSAISMLKEVINESNKLPAYALIAHYEGLISERMPKEKVAKAQRIAQAEILLTGLEAESNELHRLAKEGAYDKRLLNHIEHSNDFLKIRLKRNVIFSVLKYNIKSLFKPKVEFGAEEIANVKMITIDAAIKAITRNNTPENEEASKKAIAHYGLLFENFSHIATGKEGQEYAEMQKHLELKAIYTQRVEVRKMLESGEISHSTANTILKYIHFAELAMFAGDIIEE